MDNHIVVKKYAFLKKQEDLYSKFLKNKFKKIKFKFEYFADELRIIGMQNKKRYGVAISARAFRLKSFDIKKLIVKEFEYGFRLKAKI